MARAAPAGWLQQRTTTAHPTSRACTCSLSEKLRPCVSYSRRNASGEEGITARRCHARTRVSGDQLHRGPRRAFTRLGSPWQEDMNMEPSWEYVPQKRCSSNSATRVETVPGRKRDASADRWPRERPCTPDRFLTRWWPGKWDGEWNGWWVGGLWVGGPNRQQSAEARHVRPGEWRGHWSQSACSGRWRPARCPSRLQSARAVVCVSVGVRQSATLSRLGGQHTLLWHTPQREGEPRTVRRRLAPLLCKC